jgi:hypothetical protein
MNDIFGPEAPDDPVSDVVAMADSFSQQLVEGRYGKVRCISFVIATEEGQLDVFSWGYSRGSIVETAGMLALGIQHLWDVQKGRV